MEPLIPTATEPYGDEPAQQLDVYVPEGARGAASALVIHGGGFMSGHRRMPAVVCLVGDLLERGYIAASVGYRLARPWGPGLDHQEEDVRLAARWWSEHAADYGARADHNALIGLSAGAALALLATVDARFDRFVGVYGAYDFALLPASKVTTRILTRSKDPGHHAARSPISRGGFPQTALLVHGTADPLTTPEQAKRLHQHRLDRGLPSKLVWIQGATHGFLMDGPENPHAVTALAAIRSFLGASLELPGS